ncbi:MAG: sigma-70 family RNA polymerase sigma factor [Mariniphaga sp.]|nr:sigma-70 family RNA polymerase sigma factor [Mariniphaga sp.]
MDKSKKKKEFLDLMDKNQRMIHHICRAYSNNDDDYQDLFQDILLQLWKSFESFNNLSKFSTWMYRVSLNTAISTIRKAKNNITHVELDKVHGLSSEPEKDIDADVKLLYQAIARLGKIDKAIILLYLEEKSYDEIADILGISNSNAGVRINRAKSKLEKMLQPYFT